MPLVQHSSRSPCCQPVCLLTHAPPSLRASAPPRLVPVQTRSPPERGAASEPSAGSPLWGGAARGAFRCSDRGEGFRFGQEFCGHRRLRHKPSLFSPLPAPRSASSSSTAHSGPCLPRMFFAHSCDQSTAAGFLRLPTAASTSEPAKGRSRPSRLETHVRKELPELFLCQLVLATYSGSSGSV